jgi:glutamate synthase domain-containing protein 2
MIINIANRSAIVAPIVVEPEDNAEYIGHYTVDALAQFITELKNKYDINRMVSVKRIYNGGGYIMVALIDDEEKTHYDGIAVAGCDHGKDGNA